MAHMVDYKGPYPDKAGEFCGNYNTSNRYPPFCTGSETPAQAQQHENEWLAKMRFGRPRPCKDKYVTEENGWVGLYLKKDQPLFYFETPCLTPPELLEVDVYPQGAICYYQEAQEIMKIGIFDLEVKKCGICFRTTFSYGDIILQAHGLFATKELALAHGIKALTELFQGALDQLTKPKYQTKSKPVDAVQWFLGLKIDEISLVHYHHYYYDQHIKVGDWIVDGKVVTNEEFEQDYEVVQ